MKENTGYTQDEQDFEYVCINNNNNEAIGDTGDLCSEGFTLVDGQCQMIETIQATCPPNDTPATGPTCTTAGTTVPAECPAGYTGPGLTGQCTGTAPPPQQATCPDGSPATGPTCTTAGTTVPAVCPTGYTGPGLTGQCTGTAPPPQQATCPDGSPATGPTCTTAGTNSYQQYVLLATQVLVSLDNAPEQHHHHNKEHVQLAIPRLRLGQQHVKQILSHQVSMSTFY